MANKNITQELLKKFNKVKKKVKFPIESFEVEQLMVDMEVEKLLGFEVVGRSDLSGADIWFEIHFHSNKLNQTIIWDIDWPNSFDDIDEVIGTLLDTHKSINEWHRHLRIKED